MLHIRILPIWFFNQGIKLWLVPVLIPPKPAPYNIWNQSFCSQTRIHNCILSDHVHWRGNGWTIAGFDHNHHALHVTFAAWSTCDKRPFVESGCLGHSVPSHSGAMWEAIVPPIHLSLLAVGHKGAFVAGKPAVSGLTRHYTYAFGTCSSKFLSISIDMGQLGAVSETPEMCLVRTLRVHWFSVSGVWAADASWGLSGPRRYFVARRERRCDLQDRRPRRGYMGGPIKLNRRHTMNWGEIGPPCDASAFFYLWMLCDLFDLCDYRIYRNVSC